VLLWNAGEIEETKNTGINGSRGLDFKSGRDVVRSARLAVLPVPTQSPI